MGMTVVYLNDSNIDYNDAEHHFLDVAVWAKKQCPSFVDYSVQDVSDVSLLYDFVAEYIFKDPKDALLFQLKWR
jgi:hypothetical protein